MTMLNQHFFFLLSGRWSMHMKVKNKQRSFISVPNIKTWLGYFLGMQDLFQAEKLQSLYWIGLLLES